MPACGIPQPCTYPAQDQQPSQYRHQDFTGRMTLGKLAQNQHSCGSLPGRRHADLAGSRVLQSSWNKRKSFKQAARAIAEAEQLEAVFRSQPAIARVCAAAVADLGLVRAAVDICVLFNLSFSRSLLVLSSYAETKDSEASHQLAVRAILVELYPVVVCCAARSTGGDS